MPGSFIDTNVLVYLVSDDEIKANRAEAILQAGGTISVQVLNELTNVLRRKRRKSWPDVETVLASVQEFLTVEPITIQTYETGITFAKRYSFSIYDSMIVASALGAGCNRLWSEDMQDQMMVEGKMQIVNPFGMDDFIK